MKQVFIFVLLFPLFILGQSNFDKAAKLFYQSEYEQAAVLFERDLKTNPNHLKTIEYLGDIAAYNKSWDDAIFYYKKLKHLKPTEANYYFKYGSALGMKAREVNKFSAFGMIGEVRVSLEKAIELNPKHIEARWALVYLYINLPGIIGGSESKAVRYSNELLMLSPVDGYLSRGEIQEYFKRYLSAEAYYKKAITIGKSQVCYRKLANLYKNKMNQPEKAIIVWEEYRRLEK